MSELSKSALAAFEARTLELETERQQRSERVRAMNKSRAFEGVTTAFGPGWDERVTAVDYSPDDKWVALTVDGHRFKWGPCENGEAPALHWIYPGPGGGGDDTRPPRSIDPIVKTLADFGALLAAPVSGPAIVRAPNKRGVALSVALAASPDNPARAMTEQELAQFNAEREAQKSKPRKAR